MSAVRFLARPLLGSSFIVAGAGKLKNADDTAEQLSPVLRQAADALPIQVDEKVLARAVGASQLGAGILFALGKAPRLSASVLAVTSALNTFVEWRSADISTPAGREARRTGLLKNLSLLGGVLLASVDTNGRPSLAWRTQHLAADATKAGRRQFAGAQKHTSKAVHRAARRAEHTARRAQRTVRSTAKEAASAASDVLS
ncbi:putative membrane protein YphA (DoxX/SURF4 family) [Sinomonas atrocyanea]|uniref:DoxX family protein n=1 Tax=Sinomonas atrocyanea TaxID=37927 RepID=UPI00278576FA|nr:DoxX family protein [Sinomonas atrocyanea]MDP9886412.1 putative membrane protein YphA (DoxX/SURF4 family) [Sinomonas atrocyanea]